MACKFPEMGLVRLKQIIGDPKSKPPIPPVIPVCKATWYKGCKDRIYPPPIKLGPNTTVWRAEDIHKLIADGKWSDNEETQG